MESEGNFQSEGKFVPLERFIMCCQPLYDARISEMRNEIEDLKIRLFWAQNTPEKLEELIQDHGHIINCSCIPCHVGQRTSSETHERIWTCTWQPVFENIARECGLTVAPGEPHFKNSFLVQTMDADAHLCSGLRGDWVNFIGIGAKFRTKSWNEIKKYETFFNRVQKEIQDVYDRENEEHDRIFGNAELSEEEQA